MQSTVKHISVKLQEFATDFLLETERKEQQRKMISWDFLVTDQQQ